MAVLRRTCLAASAAPLVLVACTDLSGLASESPEADAGADAGERPIDPDAGGPAALCPAGHKECAGGCVPLDDPDYGCAADTCERCSVSNAATTICEAGKCAVGTCRSGFASCDGNKQNGCEADLGSSATCGSCTAACPASTPYCTPEGQCVIDCGALTLCGTKCVDLKTSATNCGACGKACAGAANASPKCAAGACGIECNPGFGDCGGSAGGGGGCTALKPYYADKDKDGFGAGAKVGEACTAPAGHSQALGDCLDTNDKVRPGQTAYFTAGYTSASGQISYDYDCNGSEQLALGVTTGSCEACRAGDYVSAVRPNAPPGANVYCGSGSRIASCSATASSTASNPASRPATLMPLAVTSCSTATASLVGCR